MSTAKQLKQIATRNYTREEAEAAMRDLCITTHKLEGEQAAMNEALARVREKYEAEIQALKETSELLQAKINSWADKHPDEFAKKKSVEMVHGICGYRTSPPALKTVRGVTWAKVVGLLKNAFPSYVRTKDEVDKEALIANRNVIGTAALMTVGLRVEQAETFFIEVLRDQPSEG